MNIERVEELRLKGQLEEKISILLALCFSADFAGRSYFQNRHHCRFLSWQGEELAGHLAVAFRAIQLGTECVDIIGIGEVAVAPQFRKRGIGGQLVDAALSEGRLAGADFAILFGEQPIYTDAGFVAAPNPVTITGMEGAKTGSVVTEVNPFLLVKPLGKKKWNNRAVVDLAGFAF